MRRFIHAVKTNGAYPVLMSLTPRNAWEDADSTITVSYTHLWYRKHFRLPANSKNKKVFVEFEGVRQGADSVSYTHLDVYKRQEITY